MTNLPASIRVERPDQGESYCHPAEPPKEEKTNKCDAAGNCTCGEYPDMERCKFYDKPQFYNCKLGCIFCAWGGQCLEPQGREEAKTAGR